MNKLNMFFKVISALAAVVGAIYILATYGDKIVSWAKQLLGNRNPIATFHYTAPIQREEPSAEDAAPSAEAAPAAQEAEEDIFVPEDAPVSEEAPQEAAQPLTASEEDFAG